MWQSNPSTSDRIVFESHLNAFNPGKGLLHFELSQSNGVQSELPIYCYYQEGRLIFKSQIIQVRNNVFSVQVPLEIQLLERADFDLISKKIGRDLSPLLSGNRFKEELVLNDPVLKGKLKTERSSRDQSLLDKEFDDLSLDEEDKFYADKRESPRARPKIENWVRLKTMTSDEVYFLKLFDLSRGGIGFLTKDLDLFPKYSKVRVVGFRDFDLDDPLLAQVMSYRPIDDSETEFKVGCMFDEGQA